MEGRSPARPRRRDPGTSMPFRCMVIRNTMSAELAFHGRRARRLPGRRPHLVLLEMAPAVLAVVDGGESKCPWHSPSSLYHYRPSITIPVQPRPAGRAYQGRFVKDAEQPFVTMYDSCPAVYRAGDAMVCAEGGGPIGRRSRGSVSSSPSSCPRNHVGHRMCRTIAAIRAVKARSAEPAVRGGGKDRRSWISRRKSDTSLRLRNA
jgi:hypothetical protein